MRDNTHVKNQLGLALIDSVLLAGTTFCMTVCICQLHGSRVEITLWLQKLLDGPYQIPVNLSLSALLRLVDVCNLFEWRNLVVEPRTNAKKD